MSVDDDDARSVMSRVEVATFFADDELRKVRPPASYLLHRLRISYPVAYSRLGPKRMKAPGIGVTRACRLEQDEAACVRSAVPSPPPSFSILHPQLLMTNLQAHRHDCFKPETMNDSNPPAASLEASPDAKFEGDTICPSTNPALRAEIEKIKAMLDASDWGAEVGAVNKTLFEVIRECIPSDSPLSSFLDNRSQKITRSSLVSNGYAPHAVRTPQDLWDAVGKTEPQRDYVLIVRDIDSDWCEALCTKYPGTIDRKFLLEHILGIDLQLSPISLYQAPYDSRRFVKEGVDGAMTMFEILGQAAADLQLLDYMSRAMHRPSMTEGGSSILAFDPTLRASGANLEALLAFSTRWLADFEMLRDLAESDTPAVMIQQMRASVTEQVLAIAAQSYEFARKEPGVHVNWWRAPQSGDREYSIPDIHEQFRRTKHGWAKSNAFVSCCRLASNLYLTLTSTTPSMRDDANAMGHDRMICVAPNFGSRVVVRMPDHNRTSLIDDAVADLIQQHWPVFDWKCPAEEELSAWAQSQTDGLVFASLLKETILRMGVEREEGEMRDLAYLANTEDGAEHFKRLTDFRRVLARLHQSLGDAQSAFKTPIEAELHARGLVLLRDTKTPKQSATFVPEEIAEQRPIDFTRTHLESLQGLQERLDAIKEDLNEEIQIAIGSVQVHDAQTMKKQTTWTVVLTVLAAIYLPMTLVTGIFGMNITEISSEATAPDAWWAFGA